MTYLIENASIHDFADDNTVSAWTRTLSDVIRSVESENSIVVNWFRNNERTFNPGKFQAITLDKKKTDLRL